MADGNLVYRSRKDFQIKHLGHRIELGEIESQVQGIDGAERACAIYDFRKKRIFLFYAGSIDKKDLQEVLKEYDDDRIYVIGGGTVYRQLLPQCSVAHITKIDHSYQADTYFPNLDEDPEWRITADSDEQTYFDLAYQFTRYERIGDVSALGKDL